MSSFSIRHTPGSNSTFGSMGSTGETSRPPPPYVHSPQAHNGQSVNSQIVGSMGPSNKEPALITSTWGIGESKFSRRGCHKIWDI